MKLWLIDALTTFAVGAFIFLMAAVCVLSAIGGVFYGEGTILSAFLTTCNIFAGLYIIYHIGDKYVCYYLGDEE